MNEADVRRDGKHNMCMQKLKYDLKSWQTFMQKFATIRYYQVQIWIHMYYGSVDSENSPKSPHLGEDKMPV